MTIRNPHFGRYDAGQTRGFAGRPQQHGAVDLDSREAEWRASLSPEAFKVLRQHGTERAGTSPLNAEKRDGVFHCAGCQSPFR